MNRWRILLADDHQAVREGLKALINAQADMGVVGEASDGWATIERARQLAPDVVIVDLSMPRLNGLQAIGALAQCCPATRVLIMTRHSSDGYVQQALHCGAAGYVLKQSSAAEFLRGIRVVAAGGKYLDQTITAHVMREHARGHRAAGDSGAGLSTREAEVLRLIALGYGNKEVAARLSLSVKTVEAHKANAMAKLGMHSRAELVHFAYLQGWLEDL